VKGTAPDEYPDIYLDGGEGGEGEENSSSYLEAADL
jgi:hypothetical protein